MWITIYCGQFFRRWEYQTTLPASWETYMQVKKQQLEPDVEQQTCSKLGKQEENVCGHPWIVGGRMQQWINSTMGLVTLVDMKPLQIPAWKRPETKGGEKSKLSSWVTSTMANDDQRLFNIFPSYHSPPHLNYWCQIMEKEEKNLCWLILHEFIVFSHEWRLEIEIQWSLAKYRCFCTSALGAVKLCHVSVLSRSAVSDALQPCGLWPSLRGSLQAGVLGWVAVSSSGGSARPRDQTCISCVSCINSRIFDH